MAHHTPVEEDPKELAKAQDMWSSFMGIAKWSVIGIAFLLIGMAAVFVPFSS